MRRSFHAAAASAALLACLSACASDSDPASADAPVDTLVTTESTPASSDPYAWRAVAYEDYLEAAHQLNIRPDLLRPRAGFDDGLDELCRSTPEQLSQVRQTQQANLDEGATYTAAQYMSDEVSLRIDLACPQRMGDWTSAATEAGQEAPDDSAVSDEDLARATAEEQAADDADAVDAVAEESVTEDVAEDIAEDVTATPTPGTGTAGY